MRRQANDLKEDFVKKFMAVMILGVFATIVPALRTASAQDAKAKSTQEIRWHGTIVRIDKAASFMDVRKGTTERRIHFDDSTKWTKGKASIQSSEVKEGDDVITLSRPNEKKDLVATRIDLRPPK